MSKVKKPLKKGWAYFKDFDELKANILKGSHRVYVDNKHEVRLFFNDDKTVEIAYMYIPEDLQDLFENCEYDVYDCCFDYYETTYEDFCNIFTRIINLQRLSYPKRQ